MGTGTQCAISNGTLVPVPCVSEGDTKAMNNLGVCYAYLKDVEDDILSVQCLREFKELAAMFTVV